MNAPRPLRGLFPMAAAAQVVWCLCAVRHRFFWGGDHAPWLHLAETAGLLLGAALGAFAYVRAVRFADLAHTRTWLATAALLALLAAAAPPFLSNDLWDYLSRGRVEVLGQNPYLVPVAELAKDPAMAPFAARANWNDWVLPYGPLAALLQRLCAMPDEPWLGAYAWKGLCAVAHVLTALLLAAAVRRSAGEDSARRAFVLWAWNPWFLLETCGSGHNDAFVALGLAFACAALARSNLFGTALGYGAGMLVKHGSPLAAPLLLVTAWRQRRMLGFALGTAAIAAGLYVAWQHWWNVENGLDWIRKQATVQRGSLTALVTQHVSPEAGAAVPFVGGGLVSAALLLGLRRSDDAVSFARFASVSTLLFVLLCMPNFAPWYHLWWLPFAVLSSSVPLQRALVLLAALGPASYAVFTATHAFGPAHEAAQFALAALLPTLPALAASKALLTRSAALSSRRDPSDSAARPEPS